MSIVTRPITSISEENIKHRFGSLASDVIKEVLTKALKVEKEINWNMFGHALVKEAGLLDEKKQLNFIGQLVTHKENQVKEQAKTAYKDIANKLKKLKDLK